jgi:hypothetical protein
VDPAGRRDSRSAPQPQFPPFLRAWSRPGSEPVINLHTRLASDPRSDADRAVAGAFIEAVSVAALGGDLWVQVVGTGESTSDQVPFWGRGFPAVALIEDRYDFNPRWAVAGGAPGAGAGRR